MAETEPQVMVDRIERQAAILRAAAARGLPGAKDRQMSGRFSDALVEEAKRVSGITETTELLTYALIRVALEDDYGQRLLARNGRIAKGTFVAG